MQTRTPDPRSIALGLRLAPLARAYEEAAAVATTAGDVEDAAFEAFLADRAPANEAAWQAAVAIAEPLNATKWSAFEAFRVEMQNGFTPPRSGEGFRLPLKHPDEPMCQPLDAARPRARGFSATYGASWLWLDASDGLPIKVTHEEVASEETQAALAVLREAGLEF